MRALVLSGGGSKGAYQAGALKYILGELETKYDIFCGVSVGAINSAFLSQFYHGEEKKSGDELFDLWLNISTKNIYKKWFPFSGWHSLWRSSFFDSSPLNKLIKSTISLQKIRDTKKIVSVGAVSLNSGKYTIFDQNHDSFVDAVVASASFPGMLTPVKIEDQYWIDGGVKEISPIKTAIENGAREIDIIITSPETRIKKFIEHPSTVDILKRSLDLSTDKIMANDIEKVLMYNRLAEFGVQDRYFVKLNIIRPKHNLIEDLLDFDPIKIKKMMEIGYKDAVEKYFIK